MTHPVATVLQLRVAETQSLNPLIRMIRLCAVDGSALPGFDAGAHLRVQVELPDGQTDWRHYSLINVSPDPGACAAPSAYTIAVRREDDGRGGSRYMHERVQAGQLLSVEAPKNEFPLHDAGAGGCTVLLAGGIGVTPLVSMAAQRVAERAPVRMHYAGRSRSVMAFLGELQQLLGDALLVHEDEVAGAPLDVDAVLGGCGPTDQLYVCGPKPMLDAALAKTQARGWTRERVHFEVFTQPTTHSGDQPFEVELRQSGQVLQVPADKTILEVMEEAGCDPLFDCRRGECGVCQATVLEGIPDHRDYFLSDAEKASGKLIQVCISRARSPRLVLDV